MRAHAGVHHVVAFLDALPAVVAVHVIVSADDGRDPAHAEVAYALLELTDITRARRGRNVPAVHEAVHVHLFDVPALRHFEQSVEVRVHGVHAAVGQQADEVQRAARLFAVIHRRDELGVLEKLPVLYRLVDGGDVLVNDPARADVEVSHLAVAHLTGGKSDREAARFDESVRVSCHEAVEVGGACGDDRVAPCFGTVAEAVHNDNSVGFHIFHVLWVKLFSAVIVPPYARKSQSIAITLG